MSNERYYVRFVGKFNELIKRFGYKFGKFHGRNYIAYYKSSREHGDRIYIWKRGGVAFDNMCGLTYVLLRRIKTLTPNPKGYTILMLNKLDKTIEDYDPDKHNVILCIRSKNALNNELGKQMYKEFYEKYHEICLSNEDLALLQELLTNNLVKIEREEV